MKNIIGKFYQIKTGVGNLKNILDGIEVTQIIRLIEDVEKLKAEKKYLKQDIKELKDIRAITKTMNDSKMVYPAEENDRFHKCEYIVLLNDSQTVVKIKNNGLVKTFVLVKIDNDYDAMDAYFTNYG